MDRERLTITLKKDILKRLDKTIDGARIRNRSHAIEYHLGKALGPKVRTAFILAGGQGIKMRPFTYELPKTLIPVRGKPILEYTVTMLRDAGITDLVILVGYLGEKIQEHFRDGSHFGVSIRYVKEEKEEGTAAPLLKAKRFLNSGPFLMLYGDVLIDINLHDLAAFHLAEGGEATIAITSVAEPSEFGVLKCHGSKIVEFLEKPPKSGKLSHIVNTGVYAMNPSVIARVPKKGYAMLEKDVFPKMAAEGVLRGFLFEGKWFDVGTPEIYERVLAEWRT